MNSLDELFGEALSREVLPTTQERRSAVAETAVRGARRRRRVRGTVQGLAVIAGVAVAAIAGPMVLGDDPVTPADPTPTPSPVASISEPPAIIVPADLDYASVVDERFPAAPPMEAVDWANVTAEWDVELLSFIGGGREVAGSVAAIYLTPPGGERMLAWATSDTSLVAPQLLYFDPATKTALLTGWYTVNLVDGTARHVQFADDDPVAMPLNGALGRDGNGNSLFYFYTVNSSAEYTSHVFRMTGETGAGILTGAFDPSSVWGDVFVTSASEGVNLVAVDGTTLQRFPELAGCFFQSWNVDGTFNVTCGATSFDEGETFTVNPATRDTVPLEATPTTSAIDTHRSWGPTSITSLPLWPPTLYEDDVQVADLADDLPQQPDGYSVILGVRG